MIAPHRFRSGKRFAPALLVLLLALALAGCGHEKTQKPALSCAPPASLAPSPAAPDFESLCLQPPQAGPRFLPYANGRIPDGFLKPIYQGRLIARAAASWNAMNVEARRRGVLLRPLGSLSSYRDYAGQVFLYAHCAHRGWCAYPGTSNHGWGTTVDLGDGGRGSMRAFINAHGSYYGWAKRCSDASWEPWHIKWNPGCAGARWHGRDPGPLGRSCKGALVNGHCRPILRRGSHGHPAAVRLLQRSLRRAGYCSVKVNGHYDRLTRSRVKRLQRRSGLKADAVVGVASWRKIEQWRDNISRCR